VLFYGITLLLSIVDGSAPFKSPISRLGSSIFRRLYILLPTHRVYFPWIHFSPRLHLPRRIVALVAKVLLWKPHTDNELANFNHSSTPTLDRYHVACLSQEVETTVLNTVHIQPRATASTVRDVQRSLAIAAGKLTHHVLFDDSTSIWELLLGSDISLDHARIVANLIARQRVSQHRWAYFPEAMQKLVISLLKSSSVRWDNLLGMLVSMRWAEHPTASDLADLTSGDGADLVPGDLEYLLPLDVKPAPFRLSDISMILNCIRVHLRPLQKQHDFVVSVSISDFILRCQRLSIMELAFILAYFIVFTQTHPLPGIEKLQELGFLSPRFGDKKIFFPYLCDDALLLDVFDLFNSFPSLIRNLFHRRTHRKTCGAFAIHFLIRLYQASPVMYWRVMGQLSYKEVRKCAREFSGGLGEEAVHVILNSLGIPSDPSHRLSSVHLEHYDQSLDPMAVDLERPMLDAIYSAALNNHHFGRSIIELSNVWLAIHAQTADYRQRLPIPIEHMQWVDHPIPEVIAHQRFSYHDKPEPAFINLCLHSTSFEVLLPTFEHHLKWLHQLSGDSHVPDSSSKGMSWNEMLNVLSNALRVLLRPESAPDQLSSFWRLVYPLCDTRWAELPDSWHITFLRCFFGLIDQGPAMPATASTRSVVGVSSKVSLWDGVGCFTDSH
jgi:hypothetical protein